MIVPQPQPAARGDTKLYVSTPENIWPGDWLRLTLDNPADSSLNRNMMNGTGSPHPAKQRYVRISLLVKSVNDDGSISFDRPLPLDVAVEWNPVLHWGWAGRRVVGIESLTVSFPYQTYAGPGGCTQDAFVRAHATALQWLTSSMNARLSLTYKRNISTSMSCWAAAMQALRLATTPSACPVWHILGCGM